MNLQKKFALFIVLTVFLLYLVSPINILSSNTAFADEEDTNISGSTIGGVSVSGLEQEEIAQVVTEAISNYMSEPITVIGGGEELILNAEDLQFNIDATIENYKVLTDKPWYEFWTDEKTVHLPLEVTLSDSVKDVVSNNIIWHSEETMNRILGQASYLKSHEIEAVVSDFSAIENDRLALSIEEIPEGALGISYIAQALNEKLINPKQTFSLLETLGENSNISNKLGLNFLASVLYSTILQTKFEIIERHSQNEIPSYLEPGIEAQVSEFDQKDLKFVNTTTNPVLLNATVENNSLKLEIYSNEKVSDVSVRVNREEMIAPRIINRYSTDLPIGRKMLVQEGKQGLRVSVYRIINENGVIEEQQVSRDYYAPVNRIILNSVRSLITPDSENLQQESDSNLDLDGDGLPDLDIDNFIPKDPFDLENNDSSSNENEFPPGSYYDKGGNLVTP